jgi:6,7-dimethyl-8-ribityllumazine synthase
MSGAGAPAIAVPADQAAPLRVAIVVTQWHQELMAALLDGAQRGCSDAGVKTPPVVLHVPGAFELPVAVSRLAKSGQFDAIVALGLVVRGNTPHFDYVCQGATIGITNVMTETGVPVGFGVLTCDNEQQAFERSGLPGSKEDKGHEAATAAIATALILRGY